MGIPEPSSHEGKAALYLQGVLHKSAPYPPSSVCRIPGPWLSLPLSRVEGLSSLLPSAAMGVYLHLGGYRSHCLFFKKLKALSEGSGLRVGFPDPPPNFLPTLPLQCYLDCLQACISKEALSSLTPNPPGESQVELHRRESGGECELHDVWGSLCCHASPHEACNN